MNKAFRLWALTYAVVPCISTFSYHDDNAHACCHKALYGNNAVNTAVLQSRPQKWFHVSHTNVSRLGTAHPLMMAMTVCIAAPFSVYCQVAFVHNRKLLDDVAINYTGAHPIQVLHSRHTTETYKFVVRMKWA